MQAPEVLFAASVAVGIVLQLSVLPLGVSASACAAALAIAFVARYRRAWLLVPLCLAGLRTAVDLQKREQRLVSEMLRVEGWFQVLAPEGDGVVVESGRRRLLISDPPPGVPAPGHAFRGLLRVDPLRSRADPSAFRADRWGAVRGFHGRAEVLGSVREQRSAGGPLPALRRSAARFRERAAARLGSDDAGGLLAALLLGDRRGLREDDRDAFRRAGLAHVLALSGMHTGVLAMGVGAVARCLGLRGAALAGPVLGFLLSFAFVTGGRPPILRACGTAGLAVAGTALGRRCRPLPALATVGGVLLLFHPLVLLDPGFRLSFTATGLLVLAASRSVPIRRRRLRALGSAFALSALLTLGTLPEIAGSFGRVSFLSPVTNLVAGIPAAAALGWGALAVLAPVPDAAAQLPATAARHAADTLLWLARASSTLPGGDARVPAPGPLPASLLLAACGAAATGCRRRRLFAVLAALAVSIALDRMPRDRMTVLDIGQGDAILFESRAGSVLLDAGRPGYLGTEPAAFAAALHRGRARLSAAVATHGHADHAGGFDAFFRLAVPATLVIPQYTGDTPGLLRDMARQAADAGATVLRPSSRVESLASGRILVRSPWPDGMAPADVGENGHSLVTRWRSGRTAVLLTGDLEGPGEAALTASAPASFLRAPILLAGHHGSRTSSGRKLLAAVRPSLVLVSCGAGNPHGHPHAQALARIRDIGAGLLRTDRDGSITITPTARGFRVRWERGFPGGRSLFPAIPLPRSGPFA